MDADGRGVAVELPSVHVESGSCSMQFPSVPSTTGEGTAAFATNLRIGPEKAESFPRRYRRRGAEILAHGEDDRRDGAEWSDLSLEDARVTVLAKTQDPETGHSPNQSTVRSNATSAS